MPVQISFCVNNRLLLGSQLNAKFRCVQFFREVMKNENDHREQLKSNQPILIKSIKKEVLKFAFTYDPDNIRLQNITHHYCNCIKITKNFENNYFFTCSGQESHFAPYLNSDLNQTKATLNQNRCILTLCQEKNHIFFLKMKRKKIIRS